MAIADAQRVSKVLDESYTPSTQEEINLFNGGTDDLIVTAITSNNPDFIPDLSEITLPLTLGPLQSTVFRANFSPSAPGVQTAIFTVMSNDPDEGMLTMDMTGEGLDPPIAGVDLPKVAGMISPEVTVMGNINPTGALLNGTPEDVVNEVYGLLKSMEPFPNFILSTGCDLPQETPLSNIHAFMKAGRNYRIA